MVINGKWIIHEANNFLQKGNSQQEEQSSHHINFRYNPELEPFNACRRESTTTVRKRSVSIPNFEGFNEREILKAKIRAEECDLSQDNVVEESPETTTYAGVKSEDEDNAAIRQVGQWCTIHMSSYSRITLFRKFGFVIKLETFSRLQPVLAFLRPHLQKTQPQTKTCSTV